MEKSPESYKGENKMKKYYFKNEKGHYRVSCNAIDSVWAIDCDRDFDSIRRAKQFVKKKKGYAEIYIESEESEAQREKKAVRKVERFDTY